MTLPARRIVGCTIAVLLLAGRPHGEVRASQTGMPCNGTDGTRYSDNAAVGTGGTSLLSDNKGTYADGVDGVGVYSKFAISVTTSYFFRSKRRALAFDLSRPVPGSGAINRGTITDAAGAFHAFVYWDASMNAFLSPSDMPIGAAYLSDRIEANIHAKGRTYYLQFGPFYMGACAQANGVIVPNAGDGSTQGTIIRTSATSWSVFSPPVSIGHLWDITNSSSPVDLALYYFDYRVDWVSR